MNKITLITFLLLATSKSQAAVNVTAGFSGKVHAIVSDEDHYRNSLDCYPGGKGNKLTPVSKGEIELFGGEQTTAGGSIIWSSNISRPVEKNIRTVVLSLNSSVTGLSETVQLKLTDSYPPIHERYYSWKCGHTNLVVRQSRGTVAGLIKVEYTVPENVWAIRIDRNGSGQLSRTNMKEVKGVLNENYDRALSATEVFWVKPGSKITQEIAVPENVPGNDDLGTATITFSPVAADLSDAARIDKAITFLRSQYRTFDRNLTPAELEKEAIKFIEYASGLLLHRETFFSVGTRLRSQDLAMISKSLFSMANGVHKNVGLGLAVKTAAALASYEVAMKLLTDLSVYCDKVDVYLPISDKTVKVSGLRAASFWLSRGLLTIKNYDFKQYESFLGMLVQLESSRFTYAQVRQDKESMRKIQKTYDLLTEAIDVGASPFGIALKDVEKTLIKFNTIGSAGNDTTMLMKNLADLNGMESAFVLEFFKSLRQFVKGSDDIVVATPFANQLKQIIAAQSKVTNDMSNNIRLLSTEKVEDSNSVMRMAVDMLSNQIAIFELPLEGVQYFEKVRSEYLSNNDRSQTISKVRKCVMGDM
ncbi:MAG: hypothetical protein HUU45_05320 [Leptospiraceae bacterium]|nr:hypothetical protein [Leptospiraceae bacterium]